MYTELFNVQNDSESSNMSGSNNGCDNSSSACNSLNRGCTNHDMACDGYTNRKYNGIACGNLNSKNG